MDVDTTMISYNCLTMANLAATDRNQGRWKEAEALQVVVMETTQRSPDLLSS